MDARTDEPAPEGEAPPLRATMDAYVVVSACPQDMNDTCGGNPADVQVELGC